MLSPICIADIPGAARDLALDIIACCDCRVCMDAGAQTSFPGCNSGASSTPSSQPHALLHFLQREHFQRLGSTTSRVRPAQPAQELRFCSP
eukprot:CAMPEP_0171240900 /NCGR_PEP_ID=MMETSP0790-20130122/44789_1 /TAXON_ID=2925 /ORGANISM="Alexandrium catenella, Strain OF101" /LENGTH=90 /DNA_ID=CAMNT_0011707435 /DNA_START=70 /DNA_END=339 /DNA_ORIENTATION=+